MAREVIILDGKVAKICSRCREAKTLDNYGYHAGGYLGRKSTCKKCYNETHKIWRQENPDKARANQIRYERGIEPEEYQKMHSAQEGKCAICNNKFEVLDIDHCHKSDTIRGLLCRKCNLGLGYFEDDPIRLQKALDYILMFVGR